jgi:UDP-N-acetyl-2-amino-2-deoxyglucuronate dehydrogenase
MKKIGIGIIGTGSIAEKHAMAIKDIRDAELLVLYNPRNERAKEAESKFQLPVLSDLNEFLKVKDLEVVCICTPSGVHLEPGLAAIRAGKHVLIEKPLEINLERADTLIRASEEYKVKLAVIFQNRFAEDFQKLKKGVEHGVFGRLLMGNASVNWFRDSHYYSSSQWKGTFLGDGGGALINQAIHTLGSPFGCDGRGGFCFWHSEDNAISN